MKRLSSDMTFYYKKGFPAICLGIVALVMIDSAKEVMTGTGKTSTLFWPCVVGLMGYGFFRAFAFDLADDVLDDGQHLLVRQGARSERIALTDIAEVTESAFFRQPRRLTLRLVKSRTLGREVTFVPAGDFSLLPLSHSAIFVDLSQRVAAARAQRAG